MRLPRRLLLWIALLVALVLLVMLFPPERVGIGETVHFGLWSIVPAILALILCFATREVIPSLFLGVVAGGLISGQYNIVKAFLIPSIGSESYGQILLVYLWALGGLIGIWTRTGGAVRFARWAAAGIVRGRRTAKFLAWLMGIVFHQGGTISTVLAGTTVKPVCDQEGVSHEELSYIIDSTASPVATILPFNVWPIYVGGLVAGTIPLIPDQAEGISFFFRAIPFNFYAIFAVSFTLFFAWERMPLMGRRMAGAIERAKTTGRLDREGATPLTSAELTELRVPEDYRPSLWDFIVPIVVLMGVAITPRFLVGEVYISEAFVLSVLVAMGMALARGMPLRMVIEGFVEGCKGVTVGAIILGLAVTLQSVFTELGAAHYVIERVASLLVPFLLPTLFLGITMGMAFAMGTSWGTYAVVFPLAMPLAYTLSQDPQFITLCFAAVIGGSVFGDQCSPISDTTILSSLATGADLMDHVYTQVPLALLAAGFGAVLYIPITWFVLH